MQFLCIWLSCFNEFFNSELFCSETAVQCNDEVCFGLHVLPTGEENVKFDRKKACVTEFYICWYLILKAWMQQIIISVDWYCAINHGFTDFPQTWEPLQNCRLQQGDMQQVSYKGPVNTGCHSTKVICLATLAPGICVSLL